MQVGRGYTSRGGVHMQVGRGGTQVEGVSYVHRILAVITPHRLAGGLECLPWSLSTALNSMSVLWSTFCLRDTSSLITWSLITEINLCSATGSSVLASAI